MWEFSIGCPELGQPGLLRCTSDGLSLSAQTVLQGAVLTLQLTEPSVADAARTLCNTSNLPAVALGICSSFPSPAFSGSCFYTGGPSASATAESFNTPFCSGIPTPPTPEAGSGWAVGVVILTLALLGLSALLFMAFLSHRIEWKGRHDLNEMRAERSSGGSRDGEDGFSGGVFNTEKPGWGDEAAPEQFPEISPASGGKAGEACPTSLPDIEVPEPRGIPGEGERAPHSEVLPSVSKRCRQFALEVSGPSLNKKAPPSSAGALFVATLLGGGPDNPPRRIDEVISSRGAGYVAYNAPPPEAGGGGVVAASPAAAAAAVEESSGGGGGGGKTSRRGSILGALRASFSSSVGAEAKQGLAGQGGGGEGGEAPPKEEDKEEEEGSQQHSQNPAVGLGRSSKAPSSTASSAARRGAEAQKGVAGSASGRHGVSSSAGGSSAPASAAAPAQQLQPQRKTSTAAAAATTPQSPESVTAGDALTVGSPSPVRADELHHPHSHHLPSPSDGGGGSGAAAPPWQPPSRGRTPLSEQGAPPSVLLPAALHPRRASDGGEAAPLSMQGNTPAGGGGGGGVTPSAGSAPTPVASAASSGRFVDAAAFLMEEGSPMDVTESPGAGPAPAPHAAPATADPTPFASEVGSDAPALQMQHPAAAGETASLRHSASVPPSGRAPSSHPPHPSHPAHSPVEGGAGGIGEGSVHSALSTPVAVQLQEGGEQQEQQALSSAAPASGGASAPPHDSISPAAPGSAIQFMSVGEAERLGLNDTPLAFPEFAPPHPASSAAGRLRGASVASSAMGPLPSVASTPVAAAARRGSRGGGGGGGEGLAVGFDPHPYPQPQPGRVGRSFSGSGSRGGSQRWSRGGGGGVAAYIHAQPSGVCVTEDLDIVTVASSLSDGVPPPPDPSAASPLTTNAAGSPQQVEEGGSSRGSSNSPGEPELRGGVSLEGSVVSQGSAKARFNSKFQREKDSFLSKSSAAAAQQQQQQQRLSKAGSQRSGAGSFFAAFVGGGAEVGQQQQRSGGGSVPGSLVSVPGPPQSLVSVSSVMGGVAPEGGGIAGSIGSSGMTEVRSSFGSHASNHRMPARNLASTQKSQMGGQLSGMDV